MLTDESMVLDLRELPVWERAAIVLERADALRDGEPFDFLTEVDPRALINRLEQLRPGAFAFGVRRVGDEHWRITLSRVTVNGDATLFEIALARNAVLGELDEATRAFLIDHAVEALARKGHTLCEENVERRDLGVLLEGTLGVFAGAGTRERLLFHVFPHDLFGEIEFLDAGLSVGRTVVLSKTARYALIPYAVVSQVVEREPRLLMRLAMRAAQHNRTLADALSSQVQQPILARVAAALLPYAAPERGLHPALPPLPGMTQTQVASSAGTVKEVAARAIAELERQEALRREHGHIAYLDRSRLLEIVDRD